MTKIVVCGAAGRMGKMVISKIISDKELVLSGAVEWKEHHSIGEPIDKINITYNFEEALKLSDVAIDFTIADAAIYHLSVAQRQKKPIVICTTGIAKEGLAKIKSASAQIPIVFSPTMSVGVRL